MARYRRKIIKSHTTQEGRIVYHRKKHIFSFKDAYRIIRSRENEASGSQLIYCFLMISVLLETISTALWRRVEANLEYLWLPEEKRLMLALIVKFVGLVKTAAGDFVRKLIEEVADLFPKEKDGEE